MKRDYQAPDIRILYVEATDLIATSYGLEDEDWENPGDGDYTKRYGVEKI